MEEKRIGILSTLSAPLLAMQIESLLGSGFRNIVVIADSRERTEKDLRIWQERTAGHFDGLATIFSFGRLCIPFYLTDNHNSDDTAALIREISCDVLINGGTPRKLSGSILYSTYHGIINVHPGILPQYRGATCVEWSIFHSDPVGNTAHFMNEEYDAGPIIEIESYPVSCEETYRDIRVKMYISAISLMTRAVRRVVDTDLTPQKLPPQSAGQLFKPIPEAQMAIVMERIRSGEYANSLLNYPATTTS